MKSELIPLIVIGSIFAADQVENAWLGSLEQRWGNVKQMCSDEDTRWRKAVEKQIRAEKSKLNRPGETFMADGLTYKFQKPVFSDCVGDRWNKICAEYDYEFITIWYTVRNDSDKTIVVFDHTLSYDHPMTNGDKTWKIPDYVAEDALYMSGAADLGNGLKPNTQKSMPVVFRVSKDASNFYLETQRPILKL